MPVKGTNNPKRLLGKDIMFDESIVLLNKDTVMAMLFAQMEEALEEEYQIQICLGEQALICAEGRVREPEDEDKIMDLELFKASVDFNPSKRTIDYFESKGYVFEKDAEGNWFIQPKDFDKYLQAWNELLAKYYG